MRFRQLGRSGLKVSELSLGTMTFGEEYGFGAAEDECRKMFDAYLGAGGNFIDTANIYTGGSSERMLSRMIAAERARLVVATKYSMTVDPQDPNAGGNSRKNLQQSLEASLKRLGTDYVDLYWVHAWDALTPPEELLRALDDAVRAGKVLYTGFSNVPAWVVARAQTMAELSGGSRFIALQLQYSLIERSIERELLPCAAALGMAVTAWSPLGGGVLSGKYAASPEERAGQPGRLTTTGWGKSLLSARNLAIAEVVRGVARGVGRTPTQVALRWVLQQPGAPIPVIGVRSVAQLADQLGATEFMLDAAAMATLDEASRIELGYPAALLSGTPGRRMVHGEHHEAVQPFG